MPSLPPFLADSETVALIPARFADTPTRRTGAHAPLAGGPEVAATPLAEAVVSAALLSLERDGLVRLTREPKSEWLGLKKTHTVRVAPGDRGARPPEGTAEAGLLAAVEDGREVDEVVYRWLGMLADVPADLVLSLVRDGLMARGLVERTEATQKKLLWHTTTVSYTVPKETLAAAAAAADAVRAHLDAAPTELVETLRVEIAQGLARRKDHRDPDDFDFD